MNLEFRGGTTHRSGDCRLSHVTFLKMWHLARNYFLSSLQDVGTEIFQRGNKMQQNVSFGDETQHPWGFWGSLAVTPGGSSHQLDLG